MNNRMDGTDPGELSFKAILTLNLPGGEGSAKMTITLAPTDSLSFADGRTKLLGDCTLAELCDFADELESEVWAEHFSKRLKDLASEAGTEIDVSSLDGEAVKQRTAAQWLRQTILLAEDDAKPTAEAPDPEETLPTQEEGGASPVDGMDEAPVTQALVEQELESGEREPEPEVAVSESQPVHEERESVGEEFGVETGAEPSLARVRILGRRRPLFHPTWTAVDILMNEPAFRDAQAHALTSLDREVAGVLVGPPPEKQPDGRYLVHISDVVIAKHTRMQGASVTYTPESWRYVNDKLAEIYPDESAVILGWYHTHPGFGIFLSSMDRFIHKNFFTQIWHIALVLDPLSQRCGFFCWDRQGAKVDAYEFPWPRWASGSW